MLLRTNHLIVLSDLHITPSANTGLFHAAYQLECFFGYILTEALDSVLVLAGDSFDFLAPLTPEEKPHEALLPNVLKQKIDAMVKAYPGVFLGLRKLLESSRHHVVIINGNHDAELVYPVLQRHFENQLCQLFDTMTPALALGSLQHSITWCVHGVPVRVCVNGTTTLIAHGDHIDPWNRVNHDQMRAEAAFREWGFVPQNKKGQEISHNNFDMPPGTKLVLRFLNPLKQEEGNEWLEHIHPLRGAVLPMLYAKMNIKEQREAVKVLAGPAFQSQVTSLHRQFLNKVRKDKAVRSGTNTEKELLKELFGVDNSVGVLSASRSEDEGFWRTLQKVRENEKVTKLIAELRENMRFDFSHDIHQPDEYEEDLLELFTSTQVDVVMYGHTHLAKWNDFTDKTGKGLYINTGSWLKLIPLPSPGDEEDVWRTFLRDPMARAEELFTFAEVQAHENNTVTASLKLWDWNEETQTGRVTDLALPRIKILREE